MDADVLRGMARWPGVPAAYGWLRLDRRGGWRLKVPESGRFEHIGNAALRDFIGRNYAADSAGRWYFQNGPQRVFVSLDYTPLVLRLEGDALVDHCGRPACMGPVFLDDEGSILVAVDWGVGLLDDRDLAHFASRLGADRRALPTIPRGEVAARFGFVPEPSAQPPHSLR